ncbi:hypothetical protein ACVXG7_08945 [Enterobacter hormaechei]
MALTLTPALCALLLRRDRHSPPPVSVGLTAGWTPRARFTPGWSTCSTSVRGWRCWPPQARRRWWYSAYVDAKGLPAQEDQGYFFASVQLPEAASLERTEAVMTTARELDR